MDTFPLGDFAYDLTFAGFLWCIGFAIRRARSLLARHRAMKVEIARQKRTIAQLETVIEIMRESGAVLSGKKVSREVSDGESH